MSKSSSFRRRIAKRQVPFTRTSPQTGQVITSSGNPSLDVILGGGLPIGSICLVEEDKFRTYSNVLAKYFMAEGICSRHSVFLGSLDDSPKEMIEKLPKPLEAQEIESDEIETQREQNGLRIAWRYNDLPMVNSEKANAPIGHHFNLLEHIEQNQLQFADTVIWSDDATDNDIVVNQDDDDTDEAETADSGKGNDTAYVMDYSKVVDMEGVYTVPFNFPPSAAAGGMNATGSTETSSPLPTPQPSAAAEGMNATCSTETSSSLATPSPSAAAEGMNATCSTETSSSLPTPPPPTCKPAVMPQVFENPKFFGLLKDVQQLLADDKFHSGGFIFKKSLCRVCITSLGSPLWYSDHYGEDILKFLTILRAAIRSSVSVCFITMPMHLVAKYDDSLVSKIRNLVDYAIELESFAGSDKETNPAFKEYHGLIHLRKITAINTLSAYMPETTDLAFKLRRKKFVIEKLHLPPELQDDNVTPMDTQPTLSCGSNISPNPMISMDF